VSTIVHLLLAVVLTLFLAAQARSLVVVLRHRQARVADRRPRRTDLVWSSIPIVIVLVLAARSWLAAFDVERPAVASAVAHSDPVQPGAGDLIRPSR
jgi:heme/copper-type cytochrome/quinol oxidase subunit 2